MTKPQPNGLHNNQRTMDYYKIDEHQPEEGQLVWVEHQGKPIHATYEDGVFYDITGSALEEIEKWTTIHVVY